MYAAPELWGCDAGVLPLRGMEIWRRAAGVGTCRRYLPREPWRSGDALQP